MAGMNEEAFITIDGVSYDVASLGAEALAQVRNLRFVEAEIAQLQARLAVYVTAKMAYENALRNAVPRSLQ